MGAARHIPRRRELNDQAATERRAWELRLTRYEQTRNASERDALFEHFLPLARSIAASRRRAGRVARCSASGRS
jgi:hypothetical protein